MRTVICVPRWPDNGRRDEVWKWLRHQWLEQHHPDYPILEGHAEGPGEARNLAAQAAGAWDVAIFHDADTIAHPDAIRQAVDQAHTTGRMTVAADAHMYMSKASSDRILAGEAYWMPIPYELNLVQFRNVVYRTPCSGVFAVPRQLYDRIGGYPGAGVWGNEDQIWFELCRIFGGKPQWIPDHITLHLWHEPAVRTDRRMSHRHPEANRNRNIWRELARYRGNDAQNQARVLMANQLGHVIP